MTETENRARACLADITVAVIGSGSDAHTELATQIGELLARLQVNLLTGGGRGVMEAVSKAYTTAQPKRGICIGILPCSAGHATQRPPGYPNVYVQLPIYTHLPDSGLQGRLTTSRNHINVLSAHAIVALPGSHGTASELELALEYGKPVIIFSADQASVANFPAEITRASVPDDVEKFLRAQLDLRA